MLDIFVNLLTTAGSVGKVTEASLYSNGFMVIEVEEDGNHCTLTYAPHAQETKNETP